MLYLKQEDTNYIYSNLLDSRDGSLNNLGSELVSNNDFSERGVELSPNADFTTNITGFQGYSSGTASWDSFAGGSLKAVNDGTSVWLCRTQSDITVSANKSYIITARVYIPTAYTGDDIKINISSGLSGIYWLSLNADSSIKDVWQDISYSFTTTTTSLSGKVYFRTNSNPPAGSTVYIDSVSFKEIGEDWSLSSLSGVGSAAFLSSNRVIIKNDDSGGYPKIEQYFITETGSTYKVTGTAEIGTSAQVRFRAYASGLNTYQAIYSDGSVDFTFTAVGLSTRIMLYNYEAGNTDTYCYFNNVSVKKVSEFSWLINITNDFTKESSTLLQTMSSINYDTDSNTVRYPIKVISTGTANGLIQEVLLINPGYYTYEIYKQESLTNLDITNAVVGKLVDSGKALIYNADSEVSYSEQPDGNPNNFIYIP